MRLVIVGLLIALGAAADERLEKAAALEQQAGKLLDEGKRPQAFELLAQAAELRRAARAAPARAPAPPQAARAALGEMRACLKDEDPNGALKAGERAFDAFEAWTRDFRQRKPAADADSREAALERRVARLERRLDDLLRELQPR